MAPHQNIVAQCEIYSFAELVDTNEKTIYTDLTGKFPIRSYKSSVRFKRHHRETDEMKRRGRNAKSVQKHIQLPNQQNT